MTNIYLLHGLGGSRNGTVRSLVEALKPHIRGHCIISRPQLPHSDPSRSVEDSVAFLDQLSIPFGLLVVAISLGGLTAAKLQEDGRPDLHVIAISAPTWACGLLLRHSVENRISVYSSLDEVLVGRTANWPELSEAHDLPWLTHDTERHLEGLAVIIAAYFNGDDWRASIGLTSQEHASELTQ